MVIISDLIATPTNLITVGKITQTTNINDFFASTTEEGSACINHDFTSTGISLGHVDLSRRMLPRNQGDGSTTRTYLIPSTRSALTSPKPQPWQIRSEIDLLRMAMVPALPLISPTSSGQLSCTSKNKSSGHFDFGRACRPSSTCSRNCSETIHL